VPWPICTKKAARHLCHVKWGLAREESTICARRGTIRTAIILGMGLAVVSAAQATETAREVFRRVARYAGVALAE